MPRRTASRSAGAPPSPDLEARLRRRRSSGRRIVAVRVARAPELGSLADRAERVTQDVLASPDRPDRRGAVRMHQIHASAALPTELRVVGDVEVPGEHAPALIDDLERATRSW